MAMRFSDCLERSLATIFCILSNPKGFPLACHNIYPAKIPRGSNVASKAVPRIIRRTSASHTQSYNTRSLSHTHTFAFSCSHTFASTFAFLSSPASTLTALAGFPKISKKSKDRRLWRKEDKLLRILVLLKKKRDAFRHASRMSMPCHNRIIKVAIEQGLVQQRVPS